MSILFKKLALLDQSSFWKGVVWFNSRKRRNTEDELEELLPICEQESDLEVTVFWQQCMVWLEKESPSSYPFIYHLN